MAEMIDPSVVKEASAIFQDDAADISDSGTDAAVDDFGDGSVSDMGDADSLEDCICRGCDDPVLAEAVKKAARAVFGEGITLAADDGDESVDDDGDVMNEGIMGKLGKAAAGVALAAGLSHGAMHNSHDTSAQPSGKQVCSTVVKNVWQDPDYGDLEAKYLQEELQKQRDEVASGQRARVDEQRAYTMAQTHAIQDIAQKQCKTAKR